MDSQDCNNDAVSAKGSAADASLSSPAPVAVDKSSADVSAAGAAVDEAPKTTVKDAVVDVSACKGPVPVEGGVVSSDSIVKKKVLSVSDKPVADKTSVERAASNRPLADNAPKKSHDGKIQEHRSNDDANQNKLKESYLSRLYAGTKVFAKRASIALAGSAVFGLAGLGAFTIYNGVYVSKQTYSSLLNNESRQSKLIENQREKIGRLEDALRKLSSSAESSSGQSGTITLNHKNPYDGGGGLVGLGAYDGSAVCWKPSSEESSPSYWLSKEKDLKDFIHGKKEDYVLVVDKKSQTAFLYVLNARLVEEVPVSTGRNPGDKKTNGDNKTPVGPYRVVSVEDSSGWTFDGKLAYGPFFLRLDAGNWDSRGVFHHNMKSQIGLHGTDEPYNLGSNKSHGCIRIDSRKIKKYVDRGVLRLGSYVVVLSDEYYPSKSSFDSFTDYSGSSGADKGSAASQPSKISLEQVLKKH